MAEGYWLCGLQTQWWTTTSGSPDSTAVHSPKQHRCPNQRSSTSRSQNDSPTTDILAYIVELDWCRWSAKQLFARCCRDPRYETSPKQFLFHYHGMSTLESVNTIEIKTDQSSKTRHCRLFLSQSLSGKKCNSTFPSFLNKLSNDDSKKGFKHKLAKKASIVLL